MNVNAALEWIASELAGQSETARLDAQVVLAHILGQSRAWVMAHPDATLAPANQERLQRAVERLAQGEPLPYILGHWEFYGLDFNLTPDVLIPRPETELLVERALRWLVDHPDRRRAADIGTGSGCIAISLALNQPDLLVVASDVSWGALRVARQNIARYQLDQRVLLLQCDLVEAVYPTTVEKRFDLICANLPYIPQATLAHLHQLRHEPSIALSGGVTGTVLIEKLLSRSPALLSPGGLLLLEIEASLGDKVRRLVQEAFPHSKVQVLPDLAGFDRLVIAQT